MQHPSTRLSLLSATKTLALDMETQSLGAPDRAALEQIHQCLLRIDYFWAQADVSGHCRKTTDQDRDLIDAIGFTGSEHVWTINFDAEATAAMRGAEESWSRLPAVGETALGRQYAKIAASDAKVAWLKDQIDRMPQRVSEAERLKQFHDPTVARNVLFGRAFRMVTNAQSLF